MRKLLSLILSICLLSTICAQPATAGSFTGNDDLSNPELLKYIEGEVYAQLEAQLGSEDYRIDVQARYESREATLEGIANSRETNYFGYYLSDLDIQFQGRPYVFTQGEDGQTKVIEFTADDGTWDRALQDLAIGGGIILICVTVSVVTGGLGAPAISAVFAAAAQTGTAMAFSSGSIGMLSAGIVKYVETGDMDEALKSGVAAGSKAFKWGAITGVAIGGTTKAVSLYKASHRILTPREAELKALEQYSGKEQMSFLDGEEVPYSTPGSTRPDVVRQVGDHLEAIEVKHYNLDSQSSLNGLRQTLTREVSDRITHMPPGTTQRVVLDVQGQHYSSEIINNAVSFVQDSLKNIYPNIPVDIMGV